MSTLLIDIGNSRCKWGIWAQGRIRKSGALARHDLDDPAQWSFAEGADHAVACNVGGDAIGIRVASVLRAAVDISVEFAETSASHAGVRCAYENPARLGVDRWMAVLAASRRLRGPGLVIDAGTALTIDALDGEHHHRGGYIIPGLAMMQQALTSRTANIRVDDETPPAERFGRSTSEAVRNGALTALIGSIGRAATQLASDSGMAAADVPMLFTGGDGAVIADALSRGDSYRANLVLEGLAIYAGLGK